MKSSQILEIVALKAKTYAFRSCDGATTTKCKGVGGVARRDLTLSAYKSCLFHTKELRVMQYRLTPKDYKMYLTVSKKSAINSVDLKRFVCCCGIHSLPYGHKHIISGLAFRQCPICKFTIEEMTEKLDRYIEDVNGGK